MEKEREIGYTLSVKWAERVGMVKMTKIEERKTISLKKIGLAALILCLLGLMLVS